MTNEKFPKSPLARANSARLEFIKVIAERDGLINTLRQLMNDPPPTREELYEKCKKALVDIGKWP